MDWINGWYIGLFISLVIVSFISYLSKSKLMLNIFIIALMLFSGLRYGVGIDYFVYESLIYGNFSLNYIEPLSRGLLLLARNYDEAYIFFLLTSIIYVGFIVLGLKRFKVYGVFTVFVFTLFTLSFLTSMGFIRQFVATSILFVAFSFLYDKKYMYFLLLGIVAILFHFSAIVYLLFYFINPLLRKRWSIYFYFFAIGLSLISTSLITLIINKIGFYANYLEKFGGANVSGQKIYFSLLLFTLFVLFMQKLFIKKENKGELLVFSQNMVVISISLYGVFLSFGEHLARISYHLIPFYYIWTYLIFKGISNKSVKQFYLFFIIIICMFYFFSTLYYAQFSERGDFLNNYKLILWD